MSNILRGLGALTPIGSIVAYNPGYYTNTANSAFTLVGPATNTVAGVNAYLPTTWRVCDGAALNDARSPIWVGADRYLPNLTDARFLMGSTVAGTIGGDNAMAHTHSVPAHFHGMGTGATLAIGSSGAHTHPSSDVSWSHSAGTTGTPRAYRGSNATDSATTGVGITATTASHTHVAGDFTGSIGLVTGGVSGNAEMTSGAASNTENRPLFLSSFYIVRVS